MKKKKGNNKGFTLVELLAALVILGLLVVIAAPNVMGMMQRTKLNNYVEDAKKLKSLAEYKFRSDSSIAKPGNNECIIITMNYLGNAEFNRTPSNTNGAKYLTDYSYVQIKRVADGSSYKYEYSIQMVEQESTDKYNGVKLSTFSKLSDDKEKFKTIFAGSMPSDVKKYDSRGCTKTYN